MAWYYGFNNSDLYGSNFSTVLADAPPPLDDTEEEDNDIVFRNQGKKLKTKSEKPVSPALKKLHSQSSGDESNFEITSKLPVGDQFSSDDKLSDQDEVGHADLHQESDFGDFTGFADFNSAFGPENGEQTSTQTWFSNEGDGSFIINGEIEMTDKTEISDSRDVYKCTEITSIGRSPENDSVRSLNQNKLWSNNSSFSSQEVESDDDLGDFASVISNHRNPESVTLEENGVKGTKKSSDVELRPSRNNSTDIASGDNSIIQNRNRGTKQFDTVCLSDENSVHQPKTSTSIHNEEKSHFNVPHTIGSEEQCLDANTLHVEDEVFEGFAGFPNDPKNSVDEDPCSGREIGFIVEDHGSRVEKEAGNNHNTKDTTSSISLPMTHNNEEVSKSDTLTGHEKVELKDRVNVMCNNSSTANSKEQKIAESTTSQSAPDTSYSDSCNVNRDVETKSSVKSDMEDDFIAPATQSQITKLNQVTKDLEGSISITGLENQLESGMISEDNKSYDDGFGELSDFSNTTEKSSTGLIGLQIRSHFHNDTETSDVSVSANSFFHSDQKNKEKSLNGTPSFAESKDDSDIGDLRPSEQGNRNGGSFGNFETSDGGKSTAKLEVVDDLDDEFGEFGDFSTQTQDSLNEYDNFGAFRAFDFQPNSETEKEESDDLKADNVPEEDQNDDSFGDFGSFESNAEDSSARDKNEDDTFGDYGCFASPILNSSKQNGSEDNFGDFSTFDSQSKNAPNKDHNDKTFVGFATFESNMKDSQTANQREGDSGNFGVFDFQSKCVDDFGHFESSRTEESHTEQNLVEDDFGDFDAFSAQNQNFSTQNAGEFGNFSDANSNDSSGFADFSSCQHSKGIESSLSKNINVNVHNMSAAGKKEVHGSTDERTRDNLQSQQWNTLNEGRTDKLFTPGSNVIVAQAEKPVLLCFSVSGLTRDGSSSNCDAIASLIEKDMQRSNSKVWYHLETSEEGKVTFIWMNSFSKHKKLLSLNVRPEKPPTQLGSVLKPPMASFGAGLGGSILVPEPTSKRHQSIATSGLLEPIRGSAEPVTHSVQNKNPSQPSLHPELALPDLSFVLSDGFKRTASKSDIKDNVSDTASESSSLDLDFFVPVTSAPSSDTKADSRGLYEEDLLGLNIMSSEEFLKTGSPKPPKAADASKVWQHGGVTIPLASKEKRTQLSVVAKRIIEELEDLRFMNSSVLMFPLKCE